MKKIKKRIALVAHDNMKKDLIEWAHYNKGTLEDFDIYSTGTTGGLLEKKLHMNITKLKSGALGGDQQLGSMIANGDIDFLVFFWDPLSVQPHDVDVKSLLRLSVLYNIPTACNRATADFLISSSLIGTSYEKAHPDHKTYLARKIEL